MEPMLSDFRRAAERVAYSPARVTLLSNTSGQPAGPSIATPDYWVQHLREAVRFSAAIETLQHMGQRIFIEVGPHTVLLGMARATLSSADCLLIPSLRQGRSDWQQILGALGTLYTAGVAVNWEGVEGGGHRPRRALPSYPFQRVRHWYHALDNGSTLKTTPGRSAASDEAEPERRAASDLYQVVWRAADAVGSSPTLTPVGPCLVFADSSGVGEAVAAHLRARGRRCLVAFRGDRHLLFDGDEACVVDPSRPQELAEWLAALPTTLHDIVYLWNLDARPPAGVDGLLRIVQVLAGDLSGCTRPWVTRLWVVTRGAAAADARDPIEVSHAPSWGLGGVIAAEFPEVWGGLIDLDPNASVESMGLLLAEVVSEATRGERIAFRGGERLVARLSQLALPEAAQVQLRSDATYLITGGLGDLGLGLAKWMASQGAKHLILIGRSGVTGQTIGAVRELETLGVQVIPCPADVANDDDMDRAFSQIATTLPPLRGVVHAAGVVDNGLLLEQNWERFKNVMAPKVRGAWNLHLHTVGLDLDFFVLFSSIATLLPSPGQGNYAAANAYLDALAAYRRKSGLPALSINWGPWSELGMVARQGETFRERLESHGLRLLTPTHAFQTFGRLLGAVHGQVAVMSIDWPAFQRQFPAGTEPALAVDFVRRVPGAAPAAPRYIDELAAVSESERRDMLATYLQHRLGDVLGMVEPQVPAVDQGFADMGIDSLMTLELKRRLEFDLGVSFSPVVVFNYPTIESLRDYLCELLGYENGAVSKSADAPKTVEEDLAMLEEIRNTSDDELAAFIAQEYTACQ
jgi:acyl transferase domain-containing protein